MSAFSPFFNTNVRFGDRLLNPPRGSLLLPVRNLMNWGRFSWLSSMIYLIKFMYWIELRLNPWSGWILRISSSRFSHSGSRLLTPQTIFSSSSSALLERVKGFKEEIGKIALNPFLKDCTYIFILSWNV